MNEAIQATFLEGLTIPTQQWLPHPVPYQGSKRALAPAILATVYGRHFFRLFEPFAGSAAFTLAAASSGLAEEYIISDTLCPLAEVWRLILEQPDVLADDYEQIWTCCPRDERRIAFYNQVRDEFNANHNPAKLLYLICRCAKNAVRFNMAGAFNQSPDPRRYGMRPDTMRSEIRSAHRLLAGRTTAKCADFEAAIAEATPDDLVYMDPPYAGVTNTRDRRYHQGLARERLTGVLECLVARGIPYLLSYDGRSGETTYGEPLPTELGKRLELYAGRSSQATLNGRNWVTIECLYINPALL